MRLLTSREICSELRISKTTLMRWKQSGKISSKELSKKKVLYDIDSIVSPNNTDPTKAHRVAIYARVSNTKQKPDLSRQIDLLKAFVAARGDIIYGTFSDVASGMNENRPGLIDLTDKVYSGEIDEVVVSSKDRLTRFGFSYFVNWFGRFGVKVTVVNTTAEEDFQQELTQDLISIIHHFSMKMYSNRRKIVTDCKKMLKIEENTDSEN